MAAIFMGVFESPIFLFFALSAQLRKMSLCTGCTDYMCRYLRQESINYVLHIYVGGRGESLSTAF